MLHTMKSALHESGRTVAAIARDMEMSPSALHSYLSGRQPIPERRRAAMERALKVGVDWKAYERERAKLDPSPVQERPVLPRSGPVASVAASPATPLASGRKRAPVAVSVAGEGIAGGWGEEEAPPPPPPAAQPAAPRRGLLARFVADDGAELGA